MAKRIDSNDAGDWLIVGKRDEQMIESQDTKRLVVPLGRRYRRALIASALFHLGLLLALYYLYHPSQKPATKSGRAEEPQPAIANVPANNRAVVAPQGAHADRIRESIETQIEAAAQVSTEQKLDDLDERLTQLEATAERKDIEQITKTIADVMGLDQNQYDDREPPSTGRFDTNSAQLLDVKRSQDESGKWVYQALMVDTGGHKETVPLSEADGLAAFETFEKLKQYPIADSIYRQLVMPMIQRALETR